MSSGPHLIDSARLRAAIEADRKGVCECRHPFDRHDGIKTPTRDACTGGTPGFCGCLSYRPAPMSASPVTNGEPA